MSLINSSEATQPDLLEEKRREQKPLPFYWQAHRYDQFIIPLILSAMAGLLLAFYQPQSPIIKWPFTLSVIAFSTGLIILSSRQFVIRTALILIATMMGIIWYQTAAFNSNTPHNISQFSPNASIWMEGIVENFQSDKNQYTVSITQANHQPSHGRIFVKGLPKNQPNLSGYLIGFQGNLYTPFSSNIPGTFDAVRYYQTQEVSALVNHASGLEVFSTTPIGISGQLNHWLGDMRHHITQLVHQYMPSPQGEVLGGLVLGRHAIPVDKETKNNFINTGLIHLLAASGLNVGIVAAFIYWLAQLCRLTPTLRIISAMSGVAVYALLTGLPPSIMRAATMLEIALTLKLFKKELSPLSLLCLASACLLSIKPVLIGNIGFQMSFLSTFGIIAMVPYGQNKLGPYITMVAAGIILVPLIAQIWVLPISLYFFNQFPLHALLLNILAVSVVAPLTIIGFSIGSLGILWPPIGVLLQWTATPLVSILLWIVNTGSAWQSALISVASPPVWSILVVYLLLFSWGMQLNQQYLQRDTEIIPTHASDLFTDWVPQLSLKNALIAGLILTLGVGSYNVWQSTQRNQTHISLIPLSDSHVALLLKAQQTQEVLALLPDQLSYWESRTLLDYLRHQNIHTLSAISVWSENQSATAPSLQSGGLQNVIKTLHIHHPIQPLKTAQHHHTLHWGNLTISTAVTKPQRWFKIASPQFCIQAGHTLDQTDAGLPCAINLFQAQGQQGAFRIFDQQGQNIPSAQNGVYHWTSN